VDLKDNDIRSVDVRDDSAKGGGLVGADIADESLTGSDVLDESLGGIDIAPTNSIVGNRILDTTLDVSQGGANITSSTLCNPSSDTFVTCRTQAVSTDSSANVLVIATGGFHGAASGPDGGQCRLAKNGVALGFPTTLGQEGREHATSTTPDGFALAALDTSPVSGTTSYSLQCNQRFGDIAFDDTKLVVLAVEG
jgi:hypothetical protein